MTQEEVKQDVNETNETIEESPELTAPGTLAAKAVVKYTTPTAAELLAGRPPVKQLTMQYDFADKEGQPFGFEFTLWEVIDQHALAKVAKQARTYANYDFINPRTKEKFRIDFIQAYNYALLAACMKDPNDPEAKGYTGKQLIEIGCLHGPMLSDLIWRADRLNSLEGKVEVAKKD